MPTLWGLTEAQFFALYTGFVLAATSARVVVTGGTLAERRLDWPNIFFLVIVASGLVRAGAEFIMWDSVGLLVWTLLVVGSLWFVAYQYGHVIVRRTRFWLFWVIGMVAVVAFGTGLLDLDNVYVNGSVTQGGDSLMISFMVMMILLLIMAPRRSGGSGGGGCGGDGGGCGG